MSHDFVIDVTGLNKNFAEVSAVVDLSLRVKSGEIFGFMGPNGSGKTTTIRMLCGLLVPDSAKGHCLGFDVITESGEIKQRVGYMTQSFSLYEDLSVYENLEFVARLYGISARQKKIEKIIEEFALTDRSKQLAGTLSGGWKQRLALAAALLHQPQLLLLDEPTAGVDPKARREFWDHIHRLSQEGITTLVSTHYMDEAERCTRLGYISKGQLLAEGTSEEIVQSSGLVTWEIKGAGLEMLVSSVTSMPGVLHAAMYGKTLHITGKDQDAEILKGTIERVCTSEQSWQPIEPSLEDVFIALVYS